MLLNLSSDVPFIYNNGNFIFFERKKLETELPNFFYENKKTLKDIYVLTWPWYFSSTRVWVEVINILKVLNIFDNIYFLNKLDFFKQLWYDDIYLFSGNKNKFIEFKLDWYNIVSKKDLDKNKKMEEIFELDWQSKIEYKKILNNYKNIQWNILWKDSLLKPYYIFAPIVC